MKRLLLLATCFCTLSAEPLVEPFAEDFVIEKTQLPEFESSPASLLEKEEIELSTDVSVFEVPETVNPVELSSPTPLVMDSDENIAAIIQEENEVAEEVARAGIIIDLRQVFAGSPTIYSILFVLSIASMGIWIYTFLGLRKSEVLSTAHSEKLREEMSGKRYDSALKICQENSSLLLNMVGAALKSRNHGSSTMREVMQAEGRRESSSYWQKIGLLNEIAVLAPMLGLLGTVLGMFYAFYDLNRSVESISALFDGLGISVGTTVGGLVVAILALLLHTMAKYRLMKQLTLVEKEAEVLVQSIREEQ